MVTKRERDGEWVARVEAVTSASVQRVDALAGGDDSEVFRARGESLDIVVHVLPEWMTAERIGWIHDFVRHVRLEVSEAVTPLEYRGRSVQEVNGRLVTISPYISGSPLTRESRAQRDSAAETLARIHNRSMCWVDAGAGGGADRIGRALRPLPSQLRDGELDRWWSEASGGMLQAAIHGDYYRGNLLCGGGRVVGVVDWHDAHVSPLLLEVAGATFEMCRDDGHGLDEARARQFVAAYAALGPIPPDELALLPRAMRVWIRMDVQTSIAYSDGEVSEYARRQMRAFDELRAWADVGL